MRKRTLPVLHNARRDEDGVTAVEFAMVAPVFMVMLLGIFDFGFHLYAQSVLQGSLQTAARGSTLEAGTSTADDLDEYVRRSVNSVVPRADITFSRRNYQNFEDVARPEDFSDTNGDGTCNDGEPFEDVNGNGSWDQDRGRDGLGGARDAVLYSAVAEYPRLFPLHNFIDVPPQVRIEGATVLRNQPYSEQGAREPEVENCT